MVGCERDVGTISFEYLPCVVNFEIKKKNHSWESKMAQQAKVTASRPDHLSLVSGAPVVEGERESIVTSCPLTSIQIGPHTNTDMHVR